MQLPHDGKKYYTQKRRQGFLTLYIVTLSLAGYDDAQFDRRVQLILGIMGKIPAQFNR